MEEYSGHFSDVSTNSFVVGDTDWQSRKSYSWTTLIVIRILSTIGVLKIEIHNLIFKVV
jgi:hypothetical protein